jgi:hypothetical protein
MGRWSNTSDRTLWRAILVGESSVDCEWDEYLRGVSTADDGRDPAADGVEVDTRP